MAMASNVNLSSMQVRCTCPRKTHELVQGFVRGGPRHGERRSNVSGEYPVAMCDRIVDIVSQRF